MNEIVLPVTPITISKSVNYRWLTGISILITLLFMLFVPHDQRRLRMPDPWTYEVAAEQFAQGDWLLSREQITTIMTKIRAQDDRFLLYVRVRPDAWALRQAPGHAIEMALFHTLGSTKLANAAWVIVGSVALFMALGACYDEKMAFIGVVLFLSSPISLLALHYFNMDTYAAGVSPLAAGALILWYEVKRPQSGLAPFLIGLLVGWMVVIRLTNALLLPLLILYFLKITIQKRTRGFPKALILLAVGIIIPLGILAWYNWTVFGHIFDSGYLYHSPYDQEFFWFARTADETPTHLIGTTITHLLTSSLQIIWLWLQPTILAWPLWPLAAIGFFQSWQLTTHKHTSWFWLGWVFLVYTPYTGITFGGVTTILTHTFSQTWGFFSPVRYLFPLTLPLIFLLIFVLNRWPYKFNLTLVSIYVVTSLWLFFEVLDRSSLIAGLG